MSIGQKIKSAREGAGLTQVQVARKARIAQSTLSGLESGQRNGARLETLRRIARVLEVPLAELV